YGLRRPKSHRTVLDLRVIEPGDATPVNILTQKPVALRDDRMRLLNQDYEQIHQQYTELYQEIRAISSILTTYDRAAIEAALQRHCFLVRPDQLFASFQEPWSDFSTLDPSEYRAWLLQQSTQVQETLDEIKRRRSDIRKNL